MTWITVGSLILNSILALLFIVGAFFMVRRYLRKMRPTPADRDRDLNDANSESESHLS